MILGYPNKNHEKEVLASCGQFDMITAEGRIDVRLPGDVEQGSLTYGLCL